MDHWYAHLFFCCRKKHLIFTHAQSRFSFVVSGIGKYQVRHIGQVFSKELPKAMFYEGFGAAEIKEVSERINPITFAKTESRAVVGSMNEFIRHFKWHMEDEPVGIEPDIVAINKKLNEMPMRVLKQYGLPIEEFRLIVKSNLSTNVER
ncbi:MAG: hypothetical protein HYZ83_00055 [Candidatus Omnitrophica bacterium]|nr:hypothetical protein [Candidatus Omnitrophota bacterium]